MAAPERYADTTGWSQFASSPRGHFELTWRPWCSARSLATQFPRVPGWTPRSRAIWAIGLPVSRTMRTAPSRNSGSNFLRESGMTTPHSPCLHTFGGCPKTSAQTRRLQPAARVYTTPDRADLRVLAVGLTPATSDSRFGRTPGGHHDRPHYRHC